MTLIVLGIIFLVVALIVFLCGATVATNDLEIGNMLVALIFISVSITLGITSGLLILIGLIMVLF